MIDWGRREQRSGVDTAQYHRPRLSGREKTNKEAHVRQTDEGRERGGGAGAVSLSDKSAPGPEIEQQRDGGDRVRRTHSAACGLYLATSFMGRLMSASPEWTCIDCYN